MSNKREMLHGVKNNGNGKLKMDAMNRHSWRVSNLWRHRYDSKV